MQTQDPEIQAKLLAMQKQMKGDPAVVTDSGTLYSRVADTGLGTTTDAPLPRKPKLATHTTATAAHGAAATEANRR